MGRKFEQSIPIQKKKNSSSEDSSEEEAPTVKIVVLK
jgi:hypothetical protein